MKVMISFKDNTGMKNRKIDLVNDILIWKDKIEFFYYKDEEEKEKDIEAIEKIDKELIDYYSVGDFQEDNKQ